jgi:hypothetical protein
MSYVSPLLPEDPDIDEDTPPPADAFDIEPFKADPRATRAIPAAKATGQAPGITIAFSIKPLAIAILTFCIILKKQ